MIAVLVALAGGLGAASRYVLDTLVPSAGPERMPRGTTMANLSGALLAGLLTGALSRGILDPVAALVALSGFCGGYTTFSTASLEAVRLLQHGHHWRAVGYVVTSLMGTTAAAVIGMVLARVML